MTRHLLARLGADARGATLVEFAFVAPVMLLLLMGLSDLAYQSYVQSILTGAMQKAGRDSTIQGSGTKTAAIDAAVMAVVRSVVANPSYASSRKNYSSFANIGPEPFQDNNGNNVYDKASECFTDLNGNGVWDTDPGATGQGGANDVVVYTMTVTYPRLFPLAGLMGWSSNQSVSATTILKNQPYALQNAYTPTLVCPK